MYRKPAFERAYGRLNATTAITKSGWDQVGLLASRRTLGEVTSQTKSQAFSSTLMVQLGAPDLRN
jgi:hypothetical protein